MIECSGKVLARAQQEEQLASFRREARRLRAELAALRMEMEL